MHLAHIGQYIGRALVLCLNLNFYCCLFFLCYNTQAQINTSNLTHSFGYMNELCLPRGNHHHQKAVVCHLCLSPHIALLALTLITWTPMHWPLIV